VANGWSSFFQSLLPEGFLPDAIRQAPIVYDATAGHFVRTNGYVNLPAVVIVIIVTAILVKGIQESASFNATMVGIKVAAVLFVIIVGAFYINSANWEPYAPYGWGGLNLFGYTLGSKSAGGAPVGMLAGSAIIFFAYIGFDSVSTHAEEAKRPNRDVPIGIIASLIICTVLYVLVVVVLTGMVKYTQIDTGAGVSTAFKTVGLKWAEFIIAAAGVAGITSVLLVMMLSAPRVFLAMARDGLVPPKFFADVHPKFRTPWKSTILVGSFVAVGAGLLGFASGIWIWLAVLMAGFVRDAFMAIYITMVIETDGVGSVYAGTATGLTLAISGIGNFIAPPLGNSLAVLWPGAPFLFWSALTLLGMFCLALVKKGSANAGVPVLENALTQQ